jgi:prepilin signal peptidase PulO-like enzyme (type II secretory pathway)
MARRASNYPGPGPKGARTTPNSPDRRGASGTLLTVHTALVAGMTLAGLVVGGVLDPVGQRLAEHSRALDERRRAALAEEQAAERAAKRAARHPEGEDQDDPDPDTDPGVGLADGEEETRDPLGSEADDPVEEPAGAAHLLPQGRSPGRTIAAAIVTGGLFAALAVHFGSHLVLAPFAVFVATAVAVSFTDLSFRLVPRWLIYGAVALIVPLLVLTAAVDHQWQHLSGAAIGGAAAFALFFAIWWFIPKGMGYGDVRLAGLIGITTGYLSLLHTYLAFLGGFLLGAVFGVALMLAGSSGRKTRIPFAPSLAVGAVLAIFYGAHVAQSLFGATP